jgi:hypothetical protein
VLQGLENFPIELAKAKPNSRTSEINHKTFYERRWFASCPMTCWAVSFRPQRTHLCTDTIDSTLVLELPLLSLNF